MQGLELRNGSRGLHDAHDSDERQGMRSEIAFADTAMFERLYERRSFPRKSIR